MQKSYRQLCLQDENVYTLGRSLISQCNTLVGDWGVGGGVEWSTWTRLNAKRRIPYDCDLVRREIVQLQCIYNVLRVCDFYSAHIRKRIRLFKKAQLMCSMLVIPRIYNQLGLYEKRSFQISALRVRSWISDLPDIRYE